MENIKKNNIHGKNIVNLEDFNSNRDFQDCYDEEDLLVLKKHSFEQLKDKKYSASFKSIDYERDEYPDHDELFRDVTRNPVQPCTNASRTLKLLSSFKSEKERSHALLVASGWKVKGTEICRELLDSGTNPDVHSQNSGATPLMNAIRYGAVETVQVLLDH